MQSTGTRLLLLVFGVGVVLLALVGADDLLSHSPGVVCGAGTHIEVVRTPTYDYLPDECRPNQ